MTEDRPKHPGLPVSGYRPQSGANVDAVNQNKELEERVLRRFDELARTSADVPGSLDHRWFSIARTQIEQGFMALNRAIFQPVRVALPEDSYELPPSSYAERWPNGDVVEEFKDVGKIED